MASTSILLFLKVLSDIELKEIEATHNKDEENESSDEHEDTTLVSHALAKIYMQSKHGKGGSLGSKRYACHKCSCLFRRKRHLRKHLWVNCSHKCLGCSECIAAINKSYNHLTGRGQTAAKSFTCFSCASAFHTPAGLAIHEEFHPQPGKLLQCESCSQQFGNRWELDSHQKTHITSEVHKCTSCTKAFTTPSNLAKHRRIRHKKKQDNFGEHFLASLQANEPEEQELFVKLTCDMCNVVCSNDDELRVHISRHSCENGVRCLECLEICDTTETLSKHMGIHRLRRKAQTSVKKDCKRVVQSVAPGSEQLGAECLICLDGVPCEAHREEYQKDNDGRICNLCNQSFKFRLWNAVHKCAAFPAIEDLDEKTLEENNFQCLACSKAYTSYIPLKLHFDTHLGADPQFCKLCDRKYSSVVKADYHFEVHGKNTCSKCGVFFLTKVNLLLHECGVTKAMFTCSICNEKFSSKYSYKKHWRVHPPSNEPQFKCTDCNTLFYKESNFRAHRIMHTGTYPFSCSLCDDKFLTYGQFKKHTMEHLSGTVQCEECDKVLLSGQSYVLHLKSHQNVKEENGVQVDQSTNPTTDKPQWETLKPSECQICGIVFRREYKLILHKKEVHNISTPYKFNCVFCPLGFYDKTHVRRHMENCSQRNDEQRRKVLETAQKGKLSRGPHICPVCDKKYVTRKCLDDHMFAHRDNSETPYKCVACGVGFAQECFLRYHTRACKGTDSTHVTIYKCTRCGATFKSLPLYNKHMLGHSRQLMCTLCGGKFITHQGLNKHKAVCTIETVQNRQADSSRQGRKLRPYTCPKCDKTFFFKFRYHAHLDSHDEKGSFECATCKKTFLIKSSLTRHNRRTPCGSVKLNARFNEGSSVTKMETDL